jgi:hypothetical protein
LVLAPLSVPAALHALPPLPASLGSMPHPPGAAIPAGPAPHAAPLPDLSSSVGPAGAGLLTKIGAALSTKIGVTAAAATLAVGGGAAVYKAESHGDQRRSVAASQQDPHASEWHDASHEWPAHDARWRTASHWEGHGSSISGHVGHWDSHTGTWSSQDDAHVSDGSGTTSDHASGDGTTSDHTAGDGISGTSTTHDGGTTWSPTHDAGGDTSGTHESDSGW